MTRKDKIATYNLSVWKLAEKLKIFEKVKQAQTQNKNLKERIGQTPYYIVSNIFYKNNVRYTGIHKINDDGVFEPKSGINLDEREWDMLTTNFGVVKEMVNPNTTRNQILKRSADYTSDVTLYKWAWYVNDSPVTLLNKRSGKFFTQDEAKAEGEAMKPVSGFDAGVYDLENLEMKLIPIPASAPETTWHMKIVYLFLLKNFIEKKKRETCEACVADDPSQFHHLNKGNCLDVEIDHVSVYLSEAVNSVTVTEMSMLFDASRHSIGCRPVFSQILAKAAKNYLDYGELISCLNEEYMFSEEARSVYENVAYVDKNTKLNIVKPSTDEVQCPLV